jgi:hypothetical protein
MSGNPYFSDLAKKKSEGLNHYGYLFFARDLVEKSILTRLALFPLRWIRISCS